MTEPFLYVLLLSLGSAVLAVTLTRSMMGLFAVGGVDGLEEEFRPDHVTTHTEYFSIAALAALTTAVLSVSFGTGIESLLFALFAAFGVSLSYIDFLEHLIFNILVYPMYIAVGIGLALYYNVNNLEPDFLWGALIGGVVSYVIYIIQWVLSGLRLGFGDVRLSAPVGAIAGAFGAALPIAAILAANILALIAIIVNSLMNLKSDAPKDHVAFGPFMIFGLVVALLMREPIMDWWDTNTAAVVWLFSGQP